MEGDKEQDVGYGRNGGGYAREKLHAKGSPQERNERRRCAPRQEVERCRCENRDGGEAAGESETYCVIG